MTGFIDIIVDILSISLSFGNVNLSLGAIALGVIVIRSGVHFFEQLMDDNQSREEYAHSQGYEDWGEYVETTDYLGGDSRR